MSLSTINHLSHTAQIADLENKQQNYAHSEKTVNALNEQVGLIVNEYNSQANTTVLTTTIIAIATLFNTFLDYHATNNAELSGSLKILKGLVSAMPSIADGSQKVHSHLSQGKITQIQHKIEKLKTRLSNLQQESSRSHIQEYLDVLTEAQRRLRQQYN
ncbi:hypothetical protein RHABOEDO_000909 [Candidatus Rhabdochlamydia oedothoracis]|uniref:Uncharacterized protein n=1 Tax=Candidatus Rhabdochlamydia oedothoracis TaxID=2720720 RepID=A0ABX8V0G2_9BACT|nr:MULTISPECIES: hypothetical protein [Rhabdochlamydia]KAG6559858.1 hypothetical protein RHOW815_000129 [Candidatus Rhabdochlamydia sp. W815]MCL6756645.1 hypothetical protein [Candidatus Rhabdochlamydia oedothoracis]QYF48705.1 hypothetical protein RHABOEDO_000909 [Candidatus Rhabdochlamydia oedothoracis]